MNLIFCTKTIPTPNFKLKISKNKKLHLNQPKITFFQSPKNISEHKTLKSKQGPNPQAQIPSIKPKETDNKKATQN